MRMERVPETSSLGLVVPPSSDEVSYLSHNSADRHSLGVDRHHLYWPKIMYCASPLTREFRDNRFNVVWIHRHDHNELHSRYDGVPFPDRYVMEAFLEEAKILEALDVSVRAVEMINEAIYEGRVRKLAAGEAHREHHLEAIQKNIELAEQAEVVPLNLARFSIQKALLTLEEVA